MKKQKGFSLIGVLLIISALLLTASGWEQKAAAIKPDLTKEGVIL